MISLLFAAAIAAPPPVVSPPIITVTPPVVAAGRPDKPLSASALEEATALQKQLLAEARQRNAAREEAGARLRGLARAATLDFAGLAAAAREFDALGTAGTDGNARWVALAARLPETDAKSLLAALPTYGGTLVSLTPQAAYVPPKKTAEQEAALAVRKSALDKIGRMLKDRLADRRPINEEAMKAMVGLKAALTETPGDLPAINRAIDRFHAAMIAQRADDMATLKAVIAQLTPGERAALGDGVPLLPLVAAGTPPR